MNHIYIKSAYNGETERIHEECTLLKESLKETDDLYSLYFATTSDVVICLTSSLIVRTVSPSMSHYLGYHPSELTGKKVTECGYFDEVNGKRFSVAVRRIMRRGKAERKTCRVQLKDRRGRILTGETDMTPVIINGKVDTVVCVIKDVTDKVKTEESLQKSLNEYRQFVQGSNSIILRRKPDGSITFFNAFAERFFGYGEDEIIGRNMLGTIMPEHDSEGRDMRLFLHEVSREPDRYTTYEHEDMRKQGDRVWIVWSQKVLYDEEGQIKEFLCIGNDITKYKRLERKSQQANKMEAVGRLAGGIAHDFNNLLMGIKGRSSLMLQAIDEGHPHREYLTHIEQIVDSAADLTGKLLGFARQGKYEVSVINVNAVVQASVDMFARTRKEIVVHRKFEKHLWNIEADKTQIEQVLLNLYVNAWQAMPHGGELFIETENVVINQEDSRPFDVVRGSYVKVSVTDTGVGMDCETKSQIFEPFFTTKEKKRGTGMGLASVYGIIKNHGGFIEVFSEKNQGSTFVVLLPATSKKTTVEQRETAAQPARGTETILFVDDEQVVRDVGVEIMRFLGYTVFCAKDGSEAVTVFQEHKDDIDMVIIDMIMPGMTGCEVMDRLRRIDPSVKCLMSSGYRLNAGDDENAEQSCQGFIQKPFSVGNLSKKIREVLAVTSGMPH